VARRLATLASFYRHATYTLAAFLSGEVPLPHHED
jgi:hypothetical protein